MVVSCPHCRKKLKVADNLAGKRVVCPACKKAFSLPALPEGDAVANPPVAHAHPVRERIAPVARVPIQSGGQVRCPWCKKAFRVSGVGAPSSASPPEPVAQAPPIGASSPDRPAGSVSPPPLPTPAAPAKPSAPAAAAKGGDAAHSGGKTLPFGLGRAAGAGQGQSAKAHARKFSPAAFALAILCFFFPFTHLSCQGDRVATFSGIQLVVGTRVPGGDLDMLGETPHASQQRVGPELLAVVAFVSAVAGLVVGLKKGRLRWVGGVIAGAVGALALLGLKVRIDDAVLREGEGLLSAEYGGGFYLAVLAFVCAAVLSGYFLVEAKKQGGPQRVRGPSPSGGG